MFLILYQLSIKNKFMILVAGCILLLVSLYLPLDAIVLSLWMNFALVIGLSLIISVILSFSETMVFIGIFAGLNCGISIALTCLITLLSAICQGHINFLTLILIASISPIISQIIAQRNNFLARQTIQPQHHTLATDKEKDHVVENQPLIPPAINTPENIPDESSIHHSPENQVHNTEEIYFEDLIQKNTVISGDITPPKDTDPVEEDLYLEDIAVLNVDTSEDPVTVHDTDPVEEDLYLEDIAVLNIETSEDPVTVHDTDPVEEDLYLEDIAVLNIETSEDPVTVHDTDPVEEDLYLEDIAVLNIETSEDPVAVKDTDPVEEDLYLENMLTPNIFPPDDLVGHQDASSLTDNLPLKEFEFDTIGLHQTSYQDLKITSNTHSSTEETPCIRNQNHEFLINDLSDDNQLLNHLQISDVELPYFEGLPEIDLSQSYLETESPPIETPLNSNSFPEQHPLSVVVNESSVYDIESPYSPLEDEGISIMSIEEDVNQNVKNIAQEKKSAAELLGFTEENTNVLNLDNSIGIAFETAKLSKKTPRIIDQETGQISTIGKLLVNQRDIENIIETNALLQGISGDTTGAKVISAFAGEQIQETISHIQSIVHAVNIVVAGMDGRIIGGGLQNDGHDQILAALSVNTFGILNNYFEKLSLPPIQKIILQGESFSHFYCKSRDLFYALVYDTNINFMVENPVLKNLESYKTEDPKTIYNSIKSCAGVCNTAVLNSHEVTLTSNFENNDVVGTIINNLSVVAANLNITGLSTCYLLTEQENMILSLKEDQHIVILTEKANILNLTDTIHSIVKLMSDS